MSMKWGGGGGVNENLIQKHSVVFALQISVTVVLHEINY